MAAWLYYTKRWFRRVRGYLRACPEPKEENGPELFHGKFTRFRDASAQWYVPLAKTTIV